jgi:hypothetical protein
MTNPLPRGVRIPVSGAAYVERGSSPELEIIEGCHREIP